MIEMFSEYGTIGVVVFLFAGQIVFLQKTLMSKLGEIEQICISLIERWNKSDDVSLRHREDIIRELGDLSEKISYMSGRMNGK